MKDIKRILDTAIPGLNDIFRSYNNLHNFTVFRELPVDTNIVCVDKKAEIERIIGESMDGSLAAYNRDDDRIYVVEEHVKREVDTFWDIASRIRLYDLDPLHVSLQAALTHEAFHRSAKRVELGAEHTDFILAGLPIFYNDSSVRMVSEKIASGNRFFLHGLRLSLSDFFIGSPYSDEFVVNWVVGDALDRFFSEKHFLRHPHHFQAAYLLTKVPEDIDHNLFTCAAENMNNHLNYARFLREYVNGEIASRIYDCLFCGEKQNDDALISYTELYTGNMKNLSSLIKLYN